MAQRATHLALNPPMFLVFCLFFFVFFLCFPFLFLIDKMFSHLKKGILVYFFCVSLCLSLAFFGLPLFHFLFLCLSLVLFFLPSFLFLMSILVLAVCFVLCVFVSRCSFVFVFLLVVLLVLNHTIIYFSFAYYFVVVVVVVVFCCCCFGVCYVLNFGYLSINISKTMEIPKTSKKKIAEKKNILTRTVSTSVFFFVFL